ncbi:LysE family translocator [Arthrobacter sp. SF27]|nr:LysE family translocator [Arthrobacter sp. SF27]
MYLVSGASCLNGLRLSSQNRRHAYATALGINSGAMIWGIAAAVGASALLAASETAFTALKLIGAAYMIWLGASLLWKSFRQPIVPAPDGHILGRGSQPAGPTVVHRHHLRHARRAEMAADTEGGEDNGPSHRHGHDRIRRRPGPGDPVGLLGSSPRRTCVGPGPRCAGTRPGGILEGTRFPQ